LEEREAHQLLVVKDLRDSKEHTAYTSLFAAQFSHHTGSELTI